MVTIDIDTFTEVELIDLNRRIVERLRLMHQMRTHKAMMNYSLGDRVQFHSKAGDLIRGVITRYNRQTVTIISDDRRQWNVSPSLLQLDAIEVYEQTNDEKQQKFELTPLCSRDGVAKR